MKKKPIEIEGENLFYSILEKVHHGFIIEDFTIIYERQRRISKFLKFFGIHFEYTKYKELYSIPINIENPVYSKHEIKNRLTCEYYVSLEKRNRKKEIKSGKIL